MSEAGEAGVWTADRPLVLASRSAGRRDLLAARAIPVECVPADIDERGVEAALVARGGKPLAVARALAAAKALAVSAAMPGRLVLGADQVLAVEDRCFAKAANLDEAAQRLATLSGRAHCLVSAAALARDGALLFECTDIASLRMRVLSERDIPTYLGLAGEDVLGSVGGYRIEGVGRLLFDEVAGEQATIIGLPLGRLLGYFRAAGLTRL